RPAPAGRFFPPSDQSKGSAWPPHGNAGATQLLFKLRNVLGSKMEDRSCEGGVGLSATEYIDKMLDGSGTSGGDHRNLYRRADPGCQLAIKALAGAVAVHRS